MEFLKEQKKILVIGAGMVGSAMAKDMALNPNFSVTVADNDEKKLNILQEIDNIKTIKLDVNDGFELQNLVKLHDFVISAVPGFLGYWTLKNIIEAGKDVVDISFSPENMLELNDLAIQNNVTAIVDCGVAPGMGNLILGYFNNISGKKIDSFECLVGGLPKTKKWPFNYKAPFSPVDVIEEYTRPARFIEGGNLIIREALSDVELVEFEEVGTLESFNSDGLRSLITTMSHVPNLKEKTLRYPGHVEYIKVLKESGFFDKKPMWGNFGKHSPMDFTSKILFDKWKLEPEEPEFTIMRITIDLIKESTNKRQKIVYKLYDEYDKETKTSSMARTTGYTATGMANFLLEGLFEAKGVFPPELVGQYSLKYIMEYLSDRNVKYKLDVLYL